MKQGLQTVTIEALKARNRGKERCGNFASVPLSQPPVMNILGFSVKYIIYLRLTVES